MGVTATFSELNQFNNKIYLRIVTVFEISLLFKENFKRETYSSQGVHEIFGSVFLSCHIYV